MHRFTTALAVTAAALICAAPAAAAKKKLVYVSLGDSLAWSYTKQQDGSVAQSASGYSELLAAKARAHKRYGKDLVLKKYGCPGEDTTTYLNGGRASCPQFPAGKSQHKQSLRFIKKNRKRIAFITLSIGGNNFTPCATNGGTGVDISCVQRGNAALAAHLPRIYRQIRKAAGPKAKIVVPTQYDPYLALMLRGSDYRQLALLTVDLVRQINGTIAAEARKKKARFRVADVFGAFNTASLTKTVNLPLLGAVPEAVASVCALTFMCQQPPVGPDIHPNDQGYAAMTAAFQKALRIK